MQSKKIAPVNRFIPYSYLRLWIRFNFRRHGLKILLFQPNCFLNQKNDLGQMIGDFKKKPPAFLGPRAG
jgi:hypothetical protein